MSAKVLLTGQNLVILNEIKERLPKEYELKTCEVSRGELKKVLLKFTPEVIIVCLDNEANGEMMLYDLFFRERSELSKVPIVVAGSKEDGERFDSYVENTNTTYLYRPLTYEQIYKAMCDAITKKRECSAQQIIGATQNITSKAQNVRETQTNLVHKQLAHIQDSMKKLVLVIDDDSLMLKNIKSQLTNKYHVALAMSGKIAFKFLEEHTCDVILLDYVMPVEDGPTVLKKIREIDKLKDIPVIFLTGVKDSNMVRECLSLKPQGYLLKPVDHDKLMTKLDEVLGM